MAAELTVDRVVPAPAVETEVDEAAALEEAEAEAEVVAAEEPWLSTMKAELTHWMTWVLQPGMSAPVCCSA